MKSITTYYDKNGKRSNARAVLKVKRYYDLSYPIKGKVVDGRTTIGACKTETVNVKGPWVGTNIIKSILLLPLRPFQFVLSTGIGVGLFLGLSIIIILGFATGEFGDTFTYTKVRTVVEISGCTDGHAGSLSTYASDGKCRVIFSDGSRDTVYRPVMIGDEWRYGEWKNRPHLNSWRRK